MSVLAGVANTVACRITLRLAATFHVEHILAKQHEGDDDLNNLCWSCHRCNL